MENTLAQVHAYVTAKLAVGRDLRKLQLTEQTSLLDNDLLDSTSVLELATFLESTFAIEVRDEDLMPENIGSIAAIAAFVERKRGRA